MKGKYIYGVIKTEKPEEFGKIGIGNPASEVVTVWLNNLAAVVSESPLRVYKSVAKEETVKDLVTHQFVIEKVMEKFTIIPVKFGTMLESEDEVSKFLEKGYFFLRNMLRKIEDKIELDLICFWNEQKAAQMAFQESKRVKNFYNKIASRAVRGASQGNTSDGGPKGLLRGEGIGERIALGKLVADYLVAKKKKISLQIVKTLKKEAVESCSHALADVNMLLNQAFLVERKRQKAFNHALNKLDSKFADLLNFRLVGPLPPYSFATIVVEKINPKEIEEAKKILGVNGDITTKIVSQAYRRLAQEFHPDKQKGADPLHFNLINASYRILKDFTERGFIHVDIYRFQGAV